MLKSDNQRQYGGSTSRVLDSLKVLDIDTELLRNPAWGVLHGSLRMEALGNREKGKS
jgi:hypothetical protein